jgi:predicted unusual protein kinase regulating ubiquinone biosynthesis (AarF/ABC1/UbiB family)
VQSGLDIHEKHEWAAKVLRESFMKNAGLYIKCGQVIASVKKLNLKRKMDIIVPQEYRRQFEQFCVQCPETPFQEIKRAIVKSSGKELDQIFKGSFQTYDVEAEFHP